MKVFTSKQIRALDAHTIKEEPISSSDLMERASLAFSNWFISKFPDEDLPVCIICGPGNNGGDGLAVARILHQRFYSVSLYICSIGNKTSEDFNKNARRLPDVVDSQKVVIKKGDSFPTVKPGSIIIDAIFGSGLTRPVEGFWGDLIDYLNNLKLTIISIDIPSGLFADRSSYGSIIKADYTLSFELPKLAFFFPQNSVFLGQWDSKSIGLSTSFIEQEKTPNFFITQKEIIGMVKPRNKFDHKGTFGHALLIVGSYGKMGAATLAAKAGLRSGAGLVTVHSPKCGYQILQIAIPEAMVSIDENSNHFSTVPILKNYSAVGIGCGLGTEDVSANAFYKLITQSQAPLLIDADALNILANNKEWLKTLPKNSILTPHPGEFKRLFGISGNDFDQNNIQRQMAQKFGVIIVLKGAHTCIADPEGNCYFNSTGNPGMATAGSGDVLSGIITGYLAQGYSSLEASILGVFVHGMAGDIATEEIDQNSLIAGDIINSLGKVYKRLKK
jgi:NAD(P)H-hydrate epimerase